MKLKLPILAFLVLNLSAANASESLHYSGRLVNSDGSPVSVSPANIQMDLLSGTSLVCRLNLSTPLQNGVFNVELPFDTASCFTNSFSSVIATSISSNQSLYIQVTHGSVTYPKQMISTPPVALYAKKVPNGSLVQTNFSGITANCPVGEVFLSNGSGGFSCGTVSSSTAPTGAAGGDLTGTYPNPQINTNAVQTTHILDGAVITNKIANGAVTGVKIAPMSAITGQVLKWNGTTWGPSGDAGLTSESDPTVQGFAKNAPAVCLNNETLRFDALLNSGAGGLFCAPFNTDDIPEGASKQFFTIARARSATVADTITDAVVDVAPSQNAVFDALALKADKNNSTTDMTLNSVTLQNSVRFKEQPINGINFVGLKAPANVTADIVWTLPGADGSPNMALFTDGAGNLSWAAVSSSLASGSVTADKLDQMGATTGEVLKWNGTQWDPATDEGILYENDPTVKGFAKYDPPVCPNDRHLRFDSILNSGSGGLYCAQNQFVDVAGGMNYPAGRIGIGVALPQSKLDVAGALAASSGTEFGTRILPTINQTGTAGYTSLLVNTVETSFGTGARKLLDLQVGGVTKFSVDNNGNLISTSSTTGTTAEYTSATGPQLTVGSSATEKMTASVSSTGFSTFNSIGTTPGYNFTGGNVGIGSAAPGEALDVTGNIRASGSVKTPVLSNIVDLTLIADSDSNASGALIFNTGINERMRVLNNGNVGIGTTAPANKLSVDILTTDNVNGTVANSYPIAGFINVGSGGGRRGLEIGAPTGIISSPVYLKVSGTSNRFSILNQSNTENLTVLEGGNVGIGTINPAEKLDVSGNIALTGKLRLKSDNLNYVEFLAPAALAATQTLVFPGTTGAAGNALTTNGLGILSWTTVATPTTAVGGDLTGTISNAQIVAGAIVDADVSATAAIAQSKIANLTTDLAGKEPLITAGTVAQYRRGDKTWQTLDTTAVPEGLNLYFLDSRVRSAIMATYVVGTAMPVAATDTLLEALGKLEAQIIANNTAFNNTGQWGKSGANIYYNSGNVGIGTTAPSSKLHVDGGNIRLAGVAGQTPFELHSYSSSDSLWLASSNATKSEIHLSSGNAINYDRSIALQYIPGTTGAIAGLLNIGQLSKNDVNFTHGATSFYTNGLERMRINSAGNVGIGTSTPISSLEVSNTGGHAISVRDNNNLVTDDLFQTYIQGVDSAGTVNWYVGEGSSGKLVGLMASNAGYNLFLGTNGLQRMTITETGNIGIGTTAPSTLLHVNSTSTNAGDNSVRFTAPNIGTSASHIHWGTTGDWYIRSANTSGKVIIQDVGGNVGIGTSTPAAKLEVNGDTRFGCRAGFWPIADGRICMESTMRTTTTGMHTAIAVCKTAGPGSRVCEHNDFQQACGSRAISGIPSVDPYEGVAPGWYGDHGVAASGNWDDEYGTWNAIACQDNNDGPAYHSTDTTINYYRCCY